MNNQCQNKNQNSLSCRHDKVNFVPSNWLAIKYGLDYLKEFN